MKIAIDASVVANPLTGVARYAFELSGALSACGAEVEYWTWKRLRQALERRLGPEAAIVTFPHLRGLGTAVLPSLMCRTRGIEVFHFPNGDLLRCPAPSTAMVHDLAPFIFDSILPRSFTEHYRERTRKVVARCAAVFVNSRTTLEDLERFFPEGRDRYFLTIPGSDHALPASEGSGKPPFGLSPGYLLSVGTIEPRKNYDTLLRAYGMLAQRRGPDLPKLVICGGDGYRAADTRNLAGELGLTGRAVFTGYAGESELAALYGNATGYIHSSLYEGFGFPLVEAMKRGLPIAAADNSAVRELFSGLYLPFDAGSAESAADSMESLLDGGLDDSVRAARENVLARLTWRRCAEETLAVFRSLT